MSLFTEAWRNGGDKWCQHSLAPSCRFSPCFDAHDDEWECCGDCPYMKNCSSKCEVFRPQPLYEGRKSE